MNTNDKIKEINNQNLMEDSFEDISDMQDKINDTSDKEYYDNVRSEIEQEIRKEEEEKKAKEEKAKKKTANLYKIVHKFINSHPLFLLREAQVFYYYQNGVYQKLGTRDMIQPIRKDFAVYYMKITGNYATSRTVDEAVKRMSDFGYVTLDDLDQNKNLICLKNGVYDIKNDVFLPHSPLYKITAQIPVTYNYDTFCYNFDTFLKDILIPKTIKNPDMCIYQPMIDTIYEFIGYCLYRGVPVQKALFCIGKGLNGKSTMQSVIKNFLGSHNCSFESLHGLETDQYSSAELFGKMANLCPDMKDAQLSNFDTFKRLTGDDTIRARFIRGSPFNFNNYAKLMFNANKLPDISEDEYATFRRIIPLMFPNNFEASIDTNLIEKLTTPYELSGILNKAIEGLQRLLKTGKFSYNPDIKEVMKVYRTNANPVSVFCDENLIIDDSEGLEKRLVYRLYCNWCEKTGNKPLAENIFGKKMKDDMKYETKQINGGNRSYRVYDGVNLKPPTYKQANFNKSNPPSEHDYKKTYESVTGITG